MNDTDAIPPDPAEAWDELIAAAQLVPQASCSTVPLLGPLIARLRAAWNNTTTRRRLQPLIRRQSRFNSLLADHLRQQGIRLEEREAWMLAFDRESTETRHDLAETVARLVQIKKRLAELDDRVAALERAGSDRQEPA